MKSELLVELRRHESDYPELVHGPLCGQAADRIEELEKRQLQLIDWVFLYATEGHAWISSHTADRLIELSARAPNQGDADRLKNRGLAALEAKP